MISSIKPMLTIDTFFLLVSTKELISAIRVKQMVLRVKQMVLRVKALYEDKKMILESVVPWPQQITYL